MNIDWTVPEWAYMLGVVHGDGHISKRSVSISVGYKDQDYAQILLLLWSQMGFSPKVYRPRSALKIEVHSKELRNVFHQFKFKQKWSWPECLHWPDYLAGVIDTDGCVTKNKSITIGLKRTGNLPRLAQEISKLGVREIKSKDTEQVFGGKQYLTETITICGMDRMVSLCRDVNLRHPRKKKAFVARPLTL